MNANDTSFLPHFITEEVYLVDEITSEKEKVVEVTNEVNESTEKYEVINSSLKLEYTGDNNKGIIVLVSYQNGIPASDNEFLFKILSAVMLSGKDIALIDLGINNTTEHHQLISELSYQKVIAFGTNCSIIFPDQIEMYTTTPIKNREILKAHSLSEVAEDTTKKKLLWIQLQKAFHNYPKVA